MTGRQRDRRTANHVNRVILVHPVARRLEPIPASVT